MNGPSIEPSAPPVALLQEAPLRELIVARVVSNVIALGGSGGFVLEIHLGERKALLASSRGGARTFASLATISMLLKRLDYPHFEVDVTDFTPGRVRAAQPKRSASMKAGKLPMIARKTAKQSR